MPGSRRLLVTAALGALAAPGLPRPAAAQAYPTHPARILVGFTAGGATDIQGRLVGQWLYDRLGEQFIVDNRCGASGNIATEMAARAGPDGYTLLQVVSPHAINPTLYHGLRGCRIGRCLRRYLGLRLAASRGHGRLS